MLAGKSFAFFYLLPFSQQIFLSQFLHLVCLINPLSASVIKQAQIEADIRNIVSTEVVTKVIWVVQILRLAFG